MADKLQAPSKASKRPTNPVTCPDCGSTFSREPDLKRHIMHKVACPVENCHKSFRSDKGNEFMRHVEKEHPRLDYGSCHKYFQTQKDVSLPLPGLCIPGGPERTTAELHVVQTPAPLFQSSVMPMHDGSVYGANLSYAHSPSRNKHNEALQSSGFHIPPSWQNPMANVPSLNIEDPNFGAYMFDPSLAGTYHNQYPPSPADSTLHGAQVSQLNWL
ncbi:uncharacterized protein TRUGW13939_07338 [Talaromyces rugulosus]|uniref:C2H2-type domain-containing protein n=1 Tax=Talaromyces rugulosus TaxID=121627 RepID=A0A7H8R3I5_TALRU|nr:uncharacterized protein TRUGW13939_07338 [Talaromyces rugulosus]QKX60195.1 hypothetical protein TRUGW13939_07338 [Talaromyces rugulosus]